MVSENDFVLVSANFSVTLDLTRFSFYSRNKYLTWRFFEATTLVRYAAANFEPNQSFKFIQRPVLFRKKTLS